MAMNEVLDMVAETEGKITVLAQAPTDISAKPLGHPPPEGLAGGEWGTTTFVGPQTGALAIAALPTVIGWIIILLFLPSDKTDVYKLGDKLYTPNGGKILVACKSNHFVCKFSLHRFLIHQNFTRMRLLATLRSASLST